MASTLLETDPAARDPAAIGVGRWGLGRWGVVTLALLAFLLRVYDLGGREFWFDEALTAYVSGMGWEGTIDHLRAAPFEHPPLYFLSLYPWQKLVGTTEYAFRFYSVFWGVLFVPLLYALVKRLGSERLALLSALLATVSPFLISYSQEARMYSILPCLAALALWCFCEALERQDRPVWWLAYLVLLVAGVAVHYYLALIWVATALYLLLEFLRRRQVRWVGVAAHLLLPLVVVVWVVVTPGVRESLARVGQGEMLFSLAYKLDRLLLPLLLIEPEGRQVPPVAYLLALAGWVLVLLGVWWSRRSGALNARAWLLLTLLLVISLAGSLLIPYGVLGRHLGFVLIPAFVFMAAGLAALRRWGTLPLAAGSLLVLVLAIYGLRAHYAWSNGNFGQAMAHIHARGQPGDAVVLSQPLQWPLAAYYGQDRWPVEYLPAQPAPPMPAEVEEALHSLSRAHPRLWLGPAGAWTADPERLAERWLAFHTFQAEKVWFPDSNSVTLYLTGDGELEPAGVEPVVWGGRLQLHDLYLDRAQVRPGEALRLRFLWKALVDLGERYQVNLLLVDEQGRVWAERRGEPCAGWCPTDTWPAGRIQPDQQALLIPPGTPPGVYHLQVAWLPLDGRPPLQAEEDGQLVQAVRLLEMPVLAADRPEEPWDLPNPQQVTFGGEVTLLGYQPGIAQVRLGESLVLETHWRAEKTPAADYALQIELKNEGGQVAASWSAAPSAAWVPTSQWRPGEYLRGQLPLTLPGTLAPGRYRLQVGLVAPDGTPLAPAGSVSRPARRSGQKLGLASIEVLDRPRQFDLPDIPFPLEATVGQQAHLVGYDLDLSQAHPGGQLPLTLYWQAGGPMVLPFKVFTHLVDEGGNVLAQHDAIPGGGCCPANTWAEGEMILDEHPIDLGADLPPGTYQLVVGMYDEESEDRVPAYDAAGNRLAHDRILIRPVTVEAAAAAVEATPGGAPQEQASEPSRDFEYQVFLPVVFHSPSWY